MTSPHSALTSGISMIHQELLPVPQMTVAENIFLRQEPVTWCGLVDSEKVNRDATELLDRLGMRLDPEQVMARLSLANVQLAEIAKAISYDADLVIMDERTSAITQAEIDGLFDIIRSLLAQGRSVVYITHKIDEVLRIADEVTVLRDGKYVGTDPIRATTRDGLIRKMVGRELVEMFHRESLSIGEVILEVRGLIGARFHDVTFQVRRGEIFGIAGLMGAGRTELIAAIFGLTPAWSGEICVNGKRVDIRTPSDAIACRLALFTEDRKLTGLYPDANIRTARASGCTSTMNSSMT